MKNYLLLVLFIALFTISNSSIAQTVLWLFPQVHYQDNSENTSTVKLKTNRLTNFQIVMDDSIEIRVLGEPIFREFTIKNVPAGNHTFIVKRNYKYPFKDKYNYAISLQSTGNGEKILVKLPKPKYNNFINTTRGFAIGGFAIGGFAVLWALLANSDSKW